MYKQLYINRKSYIMFTKLGSTLERIGKEQPSSGWLRKLIPSDHIKWEEPKHWVNSWLNRVGRSGLDSTWQINFVVYNHFVIFIDFFKLELVS